MAINDINQPFFLSSGLIKMHKLSSGTDVISTKIYFGRTPQKGLEKLARRLFEQFMVPVIELEMHKYQGNGRSSKSPPSRFKT